MDKQQALEFFKNLQTEIVQGLEAIDGQALYQR